MMTSLEIREKETGDLIGMCTSSFVPLPSTWIRLTGKNPVRPGWGKARVFKVNQIMNVCFDQNRGYEGEGSAHVVVYATAISKTEDVDLAGLSRPNLEVDERILREIEEKKFGTDGDEPSQN
jgi:hypothetical protein